MMADQSEQRDETSWCSHSEVNSSDPNDPSQDPNDSTLDPSECTGDNPLNARDCSAGSLHVKQSASPPSRSPSDPQLSHLLQQAAIFLTGYNDCSAETVKYLVDKERMSYEHPVIQGLQLHLSQHQQQMDLSARVLDEYQSRTSRSSSESSQEVEGGAGVSDLDPGQDSDSGLEKSANDDVLDLGREEVAGSSAHLTEQAEGADHWDVTGPDEATNGVDDVA